jgi:hypothetical protein
MSDPETPPPIPPQKLTSWQRVRVYLWSTLLVLAIMFYGAVSMFYQQPGEMLRRVLDQLPFTSSIDSAEWQTARQLTIHNVKMGDFFYADTITVTFSYWSLLRRHLTGIDVEGCQVYTKQLDAQLEKPSAVGGINIAWVIDKLTIRRGTTRPPSRSAWGCVNRSFFTGSRCKSPMTARA